MKLWMKHWIEEKHYIILALILLLAFSLRVYNLDWGLPNDDHPYSYHPDEARLLQYLGEIHPENLDFNPGDFAYPTFHMFISGAFILTASKLNLLQFGDANFFLSNVHAFANLFLFGRIVTLIFSLASILVLYLIAKEITDKTTALLPTLLFTINPISVIESHYFTLDTPMVFWMLLTILFTLRFNRGIIYYLLAGLSLGFATSTKYPGAIVLVSILTSHIMTFQLTKSSPFFTRILILLDKKLVVCALASILAFLIGVPYILFEPGTFINNLEKTFSVTSGSSVNSPSGYNIGLASWLSSWNTFSYFYHLTALLPLVFGIPIFLFLIYSLIKCFKSEKIISFTFIAYLLVVGNWTYALPRYMLPLIPLGLLLVGKQFSTKQPRFVNYLLIASIIYTLFFTISLDNQFNDTIDDATEWIYNTLPNNSVIATTLWAPLRYSPTLDPLAIQNSTLQNDLIVSRRANNITNNDLIPIKICRNTCKTFQVVTMFNPTDVWLKKYNPDFIILSSLATIGSDAPNKDYTVDSERSFYKQFPNKDYITAVSFDRPYFTRSVYILLDPRFVSQYSSPKITVLSKAS